MTIYEAHPLANLFPMMSAEEAEDLDVSIRADGLVDPIVLFEGMILDGRNRYASCERVGITPHFVHFRERDHRGQKKSPLDFVIAKNLRRRHLDASQRAMVAAGLANLADGVTKSGAQICAPVSQGDAARLLNVSRRSVQHAADVREHGAAELVEAVQTGRVAVSAASDVASRPQIEQRAIVALSDAELLAAARAIRARLNDDRRAARIDRLVAISAGARPLPGGQIFPVIYADPPWRFESGDSDRSIENHYPTMSLDEICALDVGALATPDSALFMWATIPHLSQAFDVLKAWGFIYKSHRVWTKPGKKMGYWTREAHELLLIATRGSFPCPAPPDRLISWEQHAPARHSEKPAAFAEWIERAWPTLPKLELFCRAPRPGWTAWGNQAGEAAA